MATQPARASDDRFVDLHTHSSASDGSHAPAQLVSLARDTGLFAIAITDHDTTAGLAEAACAGQRLGVEIIPGLELSAYREGVGSWHLLGYWIDPGHGRLQEKLSRVRADRHLRNKAIFERLKELGVPIDAEQVTRIAVDGPIGRPHIAQALRERGHVDSLEQAFDRLLGKDKPAYVPRKTLSPEAAIELIRAAGGVAVLAHPGHPLRGMEQVVMEIERLRPLGLTGLEVLHPAHSAGQVEAFLNLARAQDLAITGGSDFHGTFKPDQPLGRPLVSARVLDGLRDKIHFPY